MKALFFILCITLVTLEADELHRIQNIIQEITALRSSFEQVKKELDDSQKKLQNCNAFSKKEKKYKERIISLENRLKELNTLLKSKDIEKNKKHIDKNICLNNQILEENNPFPKLQLKEKYKSKSETIQRVKASSYRLNKDAKIYDAIEGNIIQEWENQRSFTSNTQSKNWIKITGYFENKIWKPAEKSMWIAKKDATKRSH